MDLIHLCEFSQDQKWELLYRASENGFDSDAFSKECGERGNTLTIIKTTNGNVFGWLCQ